MFTRRRQRKPCSYTPIAIESKLKPLPNIGNSSSTKVTAAIASRNRNSSHVSSQVSKVPCRSTDRSNRSGSVTDRDGQHVRIGKALHVVSKKARDGPKYKCYGRRSDTNLAISDAASNPTFHTGRSSDPSFEDVSRKQVYPDPYADLKSNIDSAVPLDPNAPWWLFLAEMRLQAKRQLVNLDSMPETGTTKLDDKPDRVTEAKMDGGEVKKPELRVERTPDVTIEAEKHNSKVEAEVKGVYDKKESSAKGDGNDEKILEPKSSDDAKGSEESTPDEGNENDDDDDEEEEDESGLPQAVRAMQQKSPTTSARDVVRERHRAMMEDIAKTVSRGSLMSHLTAGGFFNYDYSQHSRTNMTNHNLRKGKKKGMERLLLLLSCRASKCMGELYGTA